MLNRISSFISSFHNRLRLNFDGFVIGTLFFCLSFTPSLLPRGYVVQGIAGGLSFIIGYAFGVGLSFAFHSLPAKYRIELSRTIKIIILSVLGVLVIVFMAAGFHWQDEIRKLTQAAPVEAVYPLQTLIISGILSILLVWAARGVRHLSRYFAKKLPKRLPPNIAAISGAIIAAIVLIFLINGVLFKLVFGFINYSFGLANHGTPTGIYQPHDSSFSGSPASAIDWNTLGEKGREFVASAPSKQSIEKYTGSGNGEQPSRLYVGLESAPRLQERVDLLVKELNRTDAAKRKAILIAIPTGSGGVNAKSIESVEYLFGGSTTTLAIQYSYLPSWLSFLADQDKARQNGKELTEAVYDWWSHLDPTSRPKLLMYGESLGTLGADGAFSGASDMQNRMNGVLLAGPPHANRLWSGIVADREKGSRQVLPIYQHGEVVRFTDGVTTYDANPKDKAWEPNRVGFIQHASDPVIWASFSLMIHKPDWLKEPRGSDVLPNMRWYPFVTAWQVGLDLPFAFGATPGHGHRYSNSVTTSWIAVLDMHLTSQQTSELQKIIDSVKG